MQRNRRVLFTTIVAGIVLVLIPTVGLVTLGETQEQPTKQALTPLQLEIEGQRLRLGSADVEDRREALVRLRSLRHPAASRVALSALNDPSAIVRATAAGSVLSLPPDESAVGLLPLLGDKEEYVRQQAAYALGQAGSSRAVAALIERLTDKKDSVRGAAAVALGQIADATAVTSLAAILNRQSGLTQSKKDKKTREQNSFVLRAAAHSLGQIGNRAALPVLILVLQDDKAENDVRREAAFALGAIGDVSSIPALRSVLTVSDPYLSHAAHEAITRISRSQSPGGT
jgi:HEAT repeat protein